MKQSIAAIRIEKPGTVQHVEVPRPQVRAGEVLLRVDRVGYCGSDLSTFRGANPLVTYPRIPGHEIAATIMECGPEVPARISAGIFATVVPYTSCGTCSACNSGRPNACRFNQTLGVQRDGALAELISVPWQKVRLAPLDHHELALVEPLSVGFHAAARGRIAASDTVLVIGCGMIGLGAIASAGLERGANVIAVDVAPGKLQLAQKAGATHVIDARAASFHDQLQELTNGLGPSVVIEAVGSVSTYQTAVEEVGYAGRVVYIGYGKAPVSYETKNFVLKEIDILGSRNATTEDFDAVIELLKTKRYPTDQTITQTVPWSEGPSALERWADDPSRVTKIHVKVS
jgi:threonine dehydrogenase-like Zn-dependent dehydrogenase